MTTKQHSGDSSKQVATETVPLPRITIEFCTQCRWMLRAAYYAQELISTFQTSLGEVALIPATGGTFNISIVHRSGRTREVVDLNGAEPSVQRIRLWDRKAEGGFPEVKHLKQLVRNIIDPDRDLGHVDRHVKSAPSEQAHTESDIQSLDQTLSGSGKMPTARHEVNAGIMDSDETHVRELGEQTKRDIRRTEHLPCEECS